MLFRSDEFLFRQGPTKGLGKIQFHDYNIAYNYYDLPNIAVFKEQIDLFKKFLATAGPDEGQSKDIDYLLALGEILTLVAYGQLILEAVKMQIFPVDEVLLNQIFDFMVRDFSKYALNIYSKPSNSDAQREASLAILRSPVADEDEFQKVWNEHVYALKGVYKMRDQEF